ncbi:MAG: DNA-binding protein Alba [archaeon]
MTEETQTTKETTEQTKESIGNSQNKKSSESLSKDTSSSSNLEDTNKKEKTFKNSGKDNVIFVGIKPFMNYVTGVVMQFKNKGQEEVIVSARGKFISKAVDVVEVARRTFLKEENIQIVNIGISSEQFENKEGKRIFVSAIEIKLIKG